MKKDLHEIAQKYKEDGWKVEFTPSGSMRASKALSPVVIARLMVIRKEAIPTCLPLTWGQRIIRRLSCFFSFYTETRKKREARLKNALENDQKIKDDDSWKDVQFNAIFQGGPWDKTKKPLPQPCSRLVLSGNKDGHYIAVDWKCETDGNRYETVIMHWFDHARTIELTKSVLSGEKQDESIIVVNSGTNDMDAV